MVKSVDTLDLGSSEAIRDGSSPSEGTMYLHGYMPMCKLMMYKTDGTNQYTTHYRYTHSGSVSMHIKISCIYIT